MQLLQWPELKFPVLRDRERRREADGEFGDHRRQFFADAGISKPHGDFLHTLAGRVRRPRPCDSGKMLTHPTLLYAVVSVAVVRFASI
jgi:hypothetical protein